MKLTEHFEMVLGLVERSAPYAEIKGALLGMHEELHGAQQAAENQVETAKQKATVEAELAQLKTKIQEFQNWERRAAAAHIPVTYGVKK